MMYVFFHLEVNVKNYFLAVSWKYGLTPPMFWSIFHRHRSLESNTLLPRQNGRHFPDDIFKYIFLNENIFISTKISLKFVSRCWNKHFPALVQIMAWRRPGDEPISAPMVVNLLTHICVTRLQWVKTAGKVRIGIVRAGTKPVTIGYIYIQLRCQACPCTCAWIQFKSTHCSMWILTMTHISLENANNDVFWSSFMYELWKHKHPKYPVQHMIQN